MPTYKRLPRSRPKAADEFVTWTQKAFRWIEINWRLVLAGMGTIGVVTALILAVSSIMGSRDEKARELLYRAEKVSPVGDGAAAAFEEVFREYPRSGAAQVARLKLGDIYYDRGDYAKALEIWQPLVSSSIPSVRILGMHNIAAGKMALGDPAGAAEIYLKAYKDGKNPVGGLSYYNAAMAYENAGNFEEAKKIFEELANAETKYPELKQKGQESLIWLAAKKK